MEGGAGVSGALAGIEVIDAGEGITGPLAAMLLADYGARVVKIERPGGDPARALPGFAFWNRNKYGLTIDLESGEGRRRMRRLLEGCDLCLFTQPLPCLEALGLDPAAVSEINPGAVYLHVPSFASKGPLSLLDESPQLLAAESAIGFTQYAGHPVPVDPVFPHLAYIGALWAATAGIAALLARERGRGGQSVSVGGLQQAMVAMSGVLTQLTGAPYQRPPADQGGRAPFYRLYRCADGEWLFLAALSPAFYTKAFEVLGVLDILVDPRLDGNPAFMILPENLPWVTRRIAGVVASRPREAWLEALAAAGVPVAPVWPRERWLEHEQLRANEMVITVEDQERGPVRMPGLSIAFSETPGCVQRPAPALGARELPFEGITPAVSPPGTQVDTESGPLAGLKVLDLGTIVAGTYAGSLLAALGADVVKVEPPAGDNLRAGALTFAGYNRGKRGLVLDLSHAAGREAFYRLAARADAVVDNYRPGVLERLQIDDCRLRAINPRIVTASVSGYGDAGPLQFTPGFDPLLQAQSGMMEAQGGSGPPTFFTLPVTDVASAAMAALGVCIALLHRERGGPGQHLSTSLAAQSLFAQCGEIVEYSGRAPVSAGGPDFAGPGPLDRYYAASDGWVRLQALASDHLDALCRLGLLSPEELELGAGRLGELLGARFAAFQRDVLVSTLRGAGIPAAPARLPDELTAASAFAGAPLMEEVELAAGGRLWMVGPGASFSRTQPGARRPLPGLGEHTREVLLEGGFREDEVEGLLESGAAVQGAPWACG
jgi:crotonobetainyl-CoA:carnitine CoA-transferase CaiB-like acyl-CoA transferase